MSVFDFDVLSIKIVFRVLSYNDPLWRFKNRIIMESKKGATLGTGTFEGFALGRRV